MKCSHCSGPLRVARTRLNGKPVWECAVSEERLKALESLYEAVKGVLSSNDDWHGETVIVIDNDGYKALYEAAERLESDDTVTIGGIVNESPQGATGIS